MSFFDVFKKTTTKPLPPFAPITINEISPASTILFYGGNKLTEIVGNRLYKHPYAPPAFHAAFYIKDGMFLNVGKFKTIQFLVKELRSTRRIDVITYYFVSEEKRRAICEDAVQDADQPKIGVSLPTYAWTDYLRFGFKWFKPSKKDFCSENVVELFGGRGVKVSDEEPFNTAPWDLFEFALKNKGDCLVNTLYIGPDFGKG